MHPNRIRTSCRTLAAAALALPAAALAQGGVAQGVRAQLDRSAPPRLGAAPDLKLPPVVVRQLPNGLRLMVVERHTLPLANFVLVVPGGATLSPASRAGVAGLSADMLTEGTATRTALQISDQIAYLGISLGAESGWDATAVSLTTPTAQLDSALALFADVSLHPTFPASEFARLKQERLTELLQLRDEGPAVADRVFPAVVFGRTSPYGRPTLGTDSSVTAMTAADVAAFYRQTFVPNGATLIAVGDVTTDELARKITQLFGGWPRGTAPAATVPPSADPAQTTIYLVNKPGAAQSSFRIGNIGTARSTPDYFPLLVLNTALGGSFTSRLNQELREARGYTYGAFSRFDMRRNPGPFVASAEIVSAKSDSALADFMRILASVRDTIPAAELAKTKRYIELTLPATFETTGQVASRLSAVVLYGLPLDYFNHYVSNVEAVTQSAVQRVGQKYVDPAHMAIVVVGDRATIEQPLQATHVGPIVHLDLDANPVK